MSLLHRIASAFTPESHQRNVAENDDIRVQIARLKNEAERTIDMIDNTTGIWHQDMLEGVYARAQRDAEERHD